MCGLHFWNLPCTGAFSVLTGALLGMALIKAAGCLMSEGDCGMGRARDHLLCVLASQSPPSHRDRKREKNRPNRDKFLSYSVSQPLFFFFFCSVWIVMFCKWVLMLLRSQCVSLLGGLYYVLKTSGCLASSSWTCVANICSFTSASLDNCMKLNAI